jgi:hypothetical protein
MAIKTQGTQLYFIDPDSFAVVTVGCVTTITGLTAARDQIETTCLDSDARTYEAGMATPGAASFTINFDTSDVSHVRAHELYREGVKLDWVIGWSDGTAAPVSDSTAFTLPTSRSWIEFNGYISDLPFDFALNAVVTSNVSIQVSDFPVLHAKV